MSVRGALADPDVTGSGVIRAVVDDEELDNEAKVGLIAVVLAVVEGVFPPLLPRDELVEWARGSDYYDEAVEIMATS